MICGLKSIPFIFVFMAGLLTAKTSCSQTNHTFIRFTKEDGLSSTEVRSLFQDNKGFIWIGTANGLDMFDGVRFHHFINSETAIPSTLVLQVFRSGNRIWIHSQYEAGYLDAVTLKYHTVPIEIAGKTHPFDGSLYLDNQNNILAATPYGVCRYNGSARAFTTDSLPFRTPENWRLISIYEDQEKGNYWLLAHNGLAMYEKSTGEVYFKDHNPAHLKLFSDNRADTEVSSFLLDNKGNYWTENWNYNNNYIFRFNPVSNSMEKMNDRAEVFHGYSQYNALFQQRNGHYWMYGENELQDWDGWSPHFHSNPSGIKLENGISYGRIFQMIEDKEENLWIATDKGLYILPSQTQNISTIRFNFRDELNINSFNEIGKKTLIATWGKGILAMDSAFHITRSPYSTRDIKDINYSMVWDVHQHTHTGDVWAGCQNGRLLVFAYKTNERKLFQPLAFGGRTIRRIVEDDQGNLWFATQGGVLVKWTFAISSIRENDFHPVQNFHGIIDELYFDKKGLWIGVAGEGAYLVDPNSGMILKHFDVHSSQPLADNDVLYIRPLNDSIYYIISSAINILNLKSGTVQRITANNGLPFNRVRQACIDKNGFLWICSSETMFRYNYRTNHFTGFGPDDGFSSVFDVSQASYQTNDGKLIFGGTNEMMVFDPLRAVIKSRPPNVAISFFKVFDHYLPVDSLISLKETELPYNQNTLGIYFASTSFLQRHKITYYYMLDGLDKSWIKADGASASYNSLSPGHYVFRIKAENDEGLQSDHITTMKIYIHPPFWGTWWFMAIVAISIGLLVYYVYQLRINQLLAVQKIRSKVARDLHDDVGATLTTIGILSEMARLKTNGNEEAKELIEKISDNSGRMMEAMDDIVWSINPNNDSMQRITARMREYAVTLLEAKGIDYHFHVDDQIQNLVLKMESRRDLFLIFKETVNNLVKYSKSTFVTLAISKNHGNLIMRIEDNGVGFDLDNYKKGNGIINLKKRAKQMGGDIEIITHKQQGTTVVLQLPIT